MKDEEPVQGGSRQDRREKPKRVPILFVYSCIRSDLSQFLWIRDLQTVWLRVSCEAAIKMSAGVLVI